MLSYLQSLLRFALHPFIFSSKFANVPILRARLFSTRETIFQDLHLFSKARKHNHRGREDMVMMKTRRPSTWMMRMATTAGTMLCLHRMPPLLRAAPASFACHTYSRRIIVQPEISFVLLLDLPYIGVVRSASTDTSCTFYQRSEVVH